MIKPQKCCATLYNIFFAKSALVQNINHRVVLPHSVSPGLNLMCYGN